MKNSYLILEVEYPKEYIYILEQGIVELKPWKLMSGEWLKLTFERYQRFFPKELLVPFATKTDWGSIAFLRMNKAEDSKVIVLHGDDKQAWERREEFKSIWEWFRRASNDFIEFAINDLNY